MYRERLNEEKRKGDNLERPRMMMLGQNEERKDFFSTRDAKMENIHIGPNIEKSFNKNL